MEIVNLCPFAVGTLVWQSQPGAWTLTVCVKGTFSLVNGRDAALARSQEPIADDRYYAGDARSSLLCPSDRVPFKPRADLCVVGHAFAPGGKPAEALVARFSVGEINKSVGVIGNRVWVEGPDGLEPGPPAPFPKMPLRYERIAKGPHNPIGFDLAKAPMAGAPALPNFETIDDVAREGASVGFGPIPPTWSARKSLLAGSAAAWASKSEGPAPPGFDFGFYNSAPRDQQVELLRTSAKIVLENLHPHLPRLETRLPPVRPKVFLTPAGADRAVEIALRCDTLWIDTDRSVMAVTWRGLTGVTTGDARELGRLIVALEVKGKEVRYKHLERLIREGRTASFEPEDLPIAEEPNPLSVRYDGVKPGRSVLPMPARMPSEPAFPRLQLPSFDVEDATTDFTTLGISSAPPPNASDAPAPPSSSPAAVATLAVSPDPPIADPEAVGAVIADPPEAGRAVIADPPEAGRAPIASVPRLWEEMVSDATTQRLMKDMPRAVEAGTTVTNVALGPGLLLDEASTPSPSSPGAELDAEGGASKPPTGAPRADIDPAPVVVAVAAPARAPEPARPHDEATEGDEPQHPQTPDAPDARTPKVGVGSRAAAARRATVTAAGAPPRAGRSPRKGPIELVDYARITVDVERGETKRVLTAYGMKPADLKKLQRLWKKRTADDPAIATALAEAVEAARWE